MNTVLIADMCYHQVMAESLYYPVEKNNRPYLLLNEANYTLSPEINLHNVRVVSKKKEVRNWLHRRWVRILFLIKIIMLQKKNDLVIITSTLEYVPVLTRTICYLLVCLICQRRKNVVFVIHNVKFWKMKIRYSIFSILFKYISKKAFAFACLSEQVIKFWNEENVSERPVYLLPFLTVKDSYIGSIPVSEQEKITIAIQGTVCHKRKKYNHLEYIINQLSQSEKDKIEFVFQGPPVSDEDKCFLQKIQTKCKAEWRTNYLSDEEMMALIRKTDLFFAPLNRSYGYGIFRESGIGFDCVKYQRGAIVQASMCSPEFRSCMIQYTSKDELLNIIKDINHKQIKKVYNEVVQLSKRYSHSFWSKKINQIVGEL